MESPLAYQKNSIIVVVPTYNEAKNIGILVDGVLSLGIKVSILIVDDNSPDGTAQVVSALQNKYPDLFIINRSHKMGIGSAYIEGFNYALKNGYEIIIQMDADLSHDPKDIIGMLGGLGSVDMVVGSRYIDKAGIRDWGLGRVLLSRSANLFAKILLRIPVNDLTSGFKAIKRRVLENINFSTITSKGYAFQIEVNMRAFLKGFRILEYPIIFRGRRNEKSKMSSGIIGEAIAKVLAISFNKRC